MDKFENISKGHKLEEYKKKYFRAEKTLIRIEEDRVDKFDDKYIEIRPSLKKNYLLKDRKWWLIDKTYYEVPSVMTWNWFKSLNAGLKTLFCLFTGGLVAGVAVTPIYVIQYLNNKSATEDKKILNPSIVIDPNNSFATNVDSYTKDLVSKGTVIESKMDNDRNAVYKVYLNSSAKATLFYVNSFINIKRGDVVFGENDYTISSETEEEYNYSHTITIKANSLKQSNGEVVITPKYSKYTVFPVPPKTEDKLDFIEDSGTYKVKAKNTNIEGVVSIPSTYLSKPVVSIDNDAFIGCNKITEVYVPDSIKTIGNNAFKDLNLSFVDFYEDAGYEISNTNKELSIGENSFANNKELYYISFPEHTKEIKQYAFSNCENLTIINLSNIFNTGSPKIVPPLGTNAFQNCSSIKNIYVWNDDMKTAFSSAEGWSNFSDKFISVI